MSPEISTAMALVTVIDKMGGWSTGGVLVFIGFILPCILVYLAARVIANALTGLRSQIAATERESAKRFQIFRTDYDNNITFVENYSKLADGLNETLRRNTIAQTKLVERIDAMRIAQQ